MEPNQNKVQLLCVQIWFCMVATFSKYTSLKASARWESFGSPPVASSSSWMSLPWWRRRRRRRHKTNGPFVFNTVSTINFHFTYWFVVPFAGLVVGFDLFALRSDGIWSSIANACSGEVSERLLYITSNRNVGLRVTLPLFWCRISLSLSAERQLPLDYVFELEPVSPLAGMFVIYEMLRLFVSELLFLLVNRSPRTTVLAVPAVFAHVCARARGRTKRYRALRRAWESFSFFLKVAFCWIQRSRFAFSFGAFFARYPKLAAWVFLFCCVFLVWIGLFFVWIFEFIAVKRARSCQFGDCC